MKLKEITKIQQVFALTYGDIHDVAYELEDKVWSSINYNTEDEIWLNFRNITTFKVNKL